MKYIFILLLLSNCTTTNNFKDENLILAEEVKVMERQLQDKEDEIEYLGHQLMDCQNKNRSL